MARDDKKRFAELVGELVQAAGRVKEQWEKIGNDEFVEWYPQYMPSFDEHHLHLTERKRRIDKEVSRLKFRWVITKDRIDGGRSVGKGNFDGDAETLTEHFRLIDGDNNIYYWGRSNDSTSEKAFEPLDWAEGYSGCTGIEYHRNGKWELL